MKSGVKMGYLKDKVGINIPRPGEKFLGWKAIDPEGNSDF